MGSFIQQEARSSGMLARPTMEFDAEDVEELNARKRDQRQPAGWTRPPSTPQRSTCTTNAMPLPLLEWLERTGLSASDTGPRPVLSDFQTCAHCDSWQPHSLRWV